MFKISMIHEGMLGIFTDHSTHGFRLGKDHTLTIPQLMELRKVFDKEIVNCFNAPLAKKLLLVSPL